MWYLVIAQGARICVIWISDRLARKILKTVALASVAVYLAQRAKAINEREKRYDYIHEGAAETSFSDQEIS